MKKILTLFIVGMLVMNVLNAQVPDRMNYQAIARDPAGNAITNQLVRLRFTIRNLSVLGSILYRETSTITTNQYGLITTVVGGGTVVSGNFSTIDWENGSKFLQVEIDITGGSTFTDMGTTQLMSVPYALLAKRAEIDLVNDADASPTNELQTLSLSSDVLSISGGNSVTLSEQGRVGTNNGNFTSSTYSINTKRYVLNLTASQAGTSVPISQTVLLDLCADEDGCKVLVGMSEWDNSTTNEIASSGFQWLYYSPTNRFRVDFPSGVFNSGVDGSGGTQHLINLYNQCYLTDTPYINFVGQNDVAPGLEFLMWNTYTGPTRKCKLIIED
jgi:hypothetical protein